MNRLCINVFSGFTFEELCRISQRVGFDGVASDEGDAVNTEKIRQNRRLADKYGLYYETSHSKIPGCSDIWKNEELAQKYEAVLLTCIDNCATNEIPILVVHVESAGEDIQIDCGMKTLERIIKYAEVNNVKIAFENINNASLLYYVLDNFSNANVGFCYDSGHELFHTPGEDFLSRLGDRLMCTHLHDNDGRGDHHWLPYCGIVNFSRIAKHLKQLNYQGALTLELCYRGEIDQDAYLRQAFEKLKKLREEIRN